MPAIDRKFVAAFLFATLTGSAALAWSAEPVNRQSVSASAAADDARLARQQKFRADSLVTQKRSDDAAQLYLQALALAPDAFNFNEKFQIAKRLINAGRPSEASEILRQLVLEQPGNVPVRTEFARVLFALSQVAAASREADQILKVDPTNKDAAELKADTASLLRVNKAAAERKALADDFYQARKFQPAAKAYMEALFVMDYDAKVEEKMHIAERVVDSLAADGIVAVAQRILDEQTDEAVGRVRLAKGLNVLATAAIAQPETIVNLEPAPTSGGESAASAHARQKEVRRVRDRNSSVARKLNAAHLYLESLNFAPNAFEPSEKIRIARWFRSQNRVEDALDILEALANDQPAHIDTRLELARTRIALEQYASAISDLDDVLALDPNRRDALLMKAGALRKRGQVGAAIDQYDQLVKKDNGADARIGLFHSLVGAGRRVEARTVLSETATADESQQEEMQEAAADLAKSTRPSVEVSQSQYGDSDNSRSTSIALGVKGSVGDYDLLANVRRKSAEGATQTFVADTFTATVVTNVADAVKVSGRLGVTQLGPDVSAATTVGQLKVDLRLAATSIGVVYLQETLTANATLIEKNIQMSQSSINVNQPLPYRLTVKGAYTHKEFSDDNSGDDYFASIHYLLSRGSPALGVGYGYHYANFDHPGKKGYFDPQDFSANQVMLTGNWESDGYYVYFSMDLGQQDFSRNGFDQGRHFIAYGTATAGKALTAHWTAELNAEWSNSSGLERPEVYGDSMIGARISYTF